MYYLSTPVNHSGLPIVKNLFIFSILMNKRLEVHEAVFKHLILTYNPHFQEYGPSFSAFENN